MTLKVPRIHFDTAMLPASERFDRWRAALPACDAVVPGDAAPGSPPAYCVWTNRIS